MDTSEATAIGLAGIIGAFIVSSIAAYCTHLVWVIGKLAGDGGVTIGQGILGLAGAVVPPVGVVHGWMIWFGA